MTSKLPTVPVKISVVKTILNAMNPIFYKAETLMEDVFDGSLKISVVERAALTDIYGAGLSLRETLSDYVLQAAEGQVDQVFLPRREFQIVLDLARVLERAERMTISQTPFWSH